ncbi:MAG TPA: cobalamin-independent methionine synthase II family protein [Burkholderiales bacterium]|jgi:5-methyltetrahydropteroyltriglutamate--homocysteine methyltransferase|nr:cobalamin-independent methionine synthase II family protein [Burkholderiales bacterium]
MKHSERKILTTHVGSLPRPRELLQPLHAKDSGDAYDALELERRVADTVSGVVRRQAALGLDVINDGEHGRASFATYANTRIGGLERVAHPPRHVGRATRDSLAFPAVYEEMKRMFSARRELTGRPEDAVSLVCTGPIRYVGHGEVQADIAHLKAATAGVPAQEVFVTAISPTNLEMYFENQYYRTDEEYLVALAEAMREEYKAIVEAGFVLQVDDPRLITHYNRVPGLSLEDNRRFMALRVEILNHALEGIPEERVRFHTCYSINVAPRVHDLEMKHYADLMLKVRAQAYSIEAANPRHEHEWRIWQDLKLPEHKILVPGVVSHCVYQVEHPELVAERIERFAGVVGRERVIAGTDCGFATSRAGDEVHPDVAWAKLQALVDGARIASERLWRS